MTNEEILQEFRLLASTLKYISGSSELRVCAYQYPDLQYSRFEIIKPDAITVSTVNKIKKLQHVVNLNLKDRTGYDWYLGFDVVDELIELADRSKFKVLDLRELPALDIRGKEEVSVWDSLLYGGDWTSEPYKSESIWDGTVSKLTDQQMDFVWESFQRLLDHHVGKDHDVLFRTGWREIYSYSDTKFVAVICQGMKSKDFFDLGERWAKMQPEHCILSEPNAFSELVIDGDSVKTLLYLRKADYYSTEEREFLPKIEIRRMYDS